MTSSEREELRELMAKHAWLEEEMWSVGIDPAEVLAEDEQTMADEAEALVRAIAPTDEQIQRVLADIDAQLKEPNSALRKELSLVTALARTDEEIRFVAERALKNRSNDPDDEFEPL
jgi:hypothetical protein